MSEVFAQFQLSCHPTTLLQFCLHGLLGNKVQMWKTKAGSHVHQLCPPPQIFYWGEDKGIWTFMSWHLWRGLRNLTFFRLYSLEPAGVTSTVSWCHRTTFLTLVLSLILWQDGVTKLGLHGHISTASLVLLPVQSCSPDLTNMLTCPGKHQQS